MSIRLGYRVPLENDLEPRKCNYCRQVKQMKDFKLNRRFVGNRTRKCKSCLRVDEVRRQEVKRVE